jgi:histidinol-phosphate aminotransferase
MSACAWTPNPALVTLAPYDPARPAPPVDLHLDGNEGVGPSPELVERISRFSVDVFRRYPDAAPLEELLAARLGVARERVLVTAGADEALDRACRALLGPGREFVLPSPTFELLDHYARLAGATPVTVPWPAGPYPTPAVVAAMTPRTALVAVVSPNNPTGAVATRADLERVARAAPRALVLADLAYAEFADEDLTPAALALPNVLVTRTLSKAWGWPGCASTTRWVRPR